MLHFGKNIGFLEIRILPKKFLEQQQLWAIVRYVLRNNKYSKNFVLFKGFKWKSNKYRTDIALSTENEFATNKQISKDKYAVLILNASTKTTKGT
jgi:hypothetical protein